jgi:uncharacterized Zn finger protein
MSTPRGTTTGRRGREFASSWWGRAWIEALEQRARLDPNRLPRGRTYARHGHVGEIELRPGLVRAAVAGSRPRPYSVTIRVRTFSEAEWDGILDVISSRAAHAAALLDGDLDPGVVDDARDAGVELLPDAGDLQPRCSCPDWADPCKHAAAVCYLVASELDEDPFQLFELRGRPRPELVAALRRRRGGAAPAAGGRVAASTDALALWERDAGVVAREVWSATPTERIELPLPPPPPKRPAPPAPWPIDPPPDAPFDPVALRALATDAAGRALAMLRGEGTSGLALEPRSDLARRAAGALGTDHWPALVARAGLGATELGRLALAWRHGGEAAVAMLDEPDWTPDAGVLAGACRVLEDAGVPAESVRVSRNRVTAPSLGAQFRLGRDGCWWGFTKRANRWELATGGSTDVEDVVDALVTVPQLRAGGWSDGGR